MKKFLFCVFDIKSGQHGLPFVMESDESAKRSFLDSLAEVRMPTLLSKFPSDYELRRLGSYDTQTGELVGEKPVFVANAATYGVDLVNEIQKRKDLMIDEHALRVAEEKYNKLAEATFKKVYAKEISNAE